MTKRRRNFWPFDDKRLSARQTTPARGGIVAHMEKGRKQHTDAVLVAGSYRGYKIWKTVDGEFYSDFEPESLFESKADIKKFVDSFKKGRNPGVRQGKWVPVYAVKFNRNGSISLMK